MAMDLVPLPRLVCPMKSHPYLQGSLFAMVVAGLFGSAPAAEGEWEQWFKDGLGDAKVVSGVATYKVEDGVLVGTTVEGSGNTFLVKGPYKDFELEFDVKTEDAPALQAAAPRKPKAETPAPLPAPARNEAPAPPASKPRFAARPSVAFRPEAKFEPDR